MIPPLCVSQTAEAHFAINLRDDDTVRDGLVDLYEERTKKAGWHLNDEELLTWFLDTFFYCHEGTWRERIIN